MTTKMTAKEYAHHRGVNPSYISHIKKKGFLDSALVEQDGKKRVLIDSEKADAALDAILDPNYRKGGPVTTKGQIDEQGIRSSGSNDTFIQARTESERMRAADRKLNYEIKLGKWVLKSQIRDETFKAGRIFRDAMLDIPNRIDAILAAETDRHTVNRLLTEEIELVLKELVRMLGQMTVD